jgi:hypothetical protein
MEVKIIMAKLCSLCFKCMSVTTKECKPNYFPFLHYDKATVNLQIVSLPIALFSRTGARGKQRDRDSPGKSHMPKWALEW